MAFYISAKVLAVTKKVEVVIDITKLGKIQKDTLITALETGILFGHGVPTEVAEGVLERYGVPYAKISNWQLWWGGAIMHESLREASEASLVKAILESDGSIDTQRVNHFVHTLATCKEGSMYGAHFGGDIRGKKARAQLKFYELATQPEGFRELVAGIKSGAVTEVNYVNHIYQ